MNMTGGGFGRMGRMDDDDGDGYKIPAHLCMSNISNKYFGILNFWHFQIKLA